jgi:uncharacterized protein with HEPN domain
VTRSDVERIDDMLEIAGEIAAIVDRGRTSFDGDVVLRRALERCLEIFGEAAKTVSSPVQQTVDIPWSDIARLRDLVSHHYHRVEPGQVWAIATQDIPDAVAALHRWRATQEDS